MNNALDQIKDKLQGAQEIKFREIRIQIGTTYLIYKSNLRDISRDMFDDED